MKKSNLLILEAIGSRLDKIIKYYSDTLIKNESLNNSLIWLKKDIGDILNEEFYT